MFSILRVVGLAAIVGTFAQAQVAVAQSSPGLCVDQLSAKYRYFEETFTVQFQAERFRPEGTVNSVPCYTVPLVHLQNKFLWDALVENPADARKIKGLTENRYTKPFAEVGDVILPLEARICDEPNGRKWLTVLAYVKPENANGLVTDFMSRYTLRNAVFTKQSYCLAPSNQVDLLTQALQFLLSK